MCRRKIAFPTNLWYRWQRAWPVQCSDPKSYLVAMASSLALLKQFLRHPWHVGAIAASGPGLVRTMVGDLDWANIDAAVEYGPGTGVFTEAIGRALRPDAKFFAIERSEPLVWLSRQRCPSLEICHDDVCNVRKLCDERGIDQVQAIVCGLPWAAFSDELQRRIMDSMFDVLSPGGRFDTFAYLQGTALPAGRKFSARLRENFSSVKRSPVVWRNLPPAFVYRCVR